MRRQVAVCQRRTRSGRATNATGALVMAASVRNDLRAGVTVVVTVPSRCQARLVRFTSPASLAEAGDRVAAGPVAPIRDHPVLPDGAGDHSEIQRAAHPRIVNEELAARQRGQGASSNARSALDTSSLGS